MSNPHFMHDWVLQRLTIDWSSGKARASVRSSDRHVEICASGLRELRLPRHQNWGPSGSINAVEGPDQSDDGLTHLKVEMQSGDLIEIVAESIKMPSEELDRSLPILRFGLFQNFKEPRQTLLLWGDDPGIASLQEVFQELAGGIQQQTALHEMQWVEGIQDAHLVLALESSGCDAAIDVKETNGFTTVTWSGAPDEFARYAELIASLVDASCPEGHQYLDSMGGLPLQIVVSKGEYPDSFGYDH